MTTGEAKEQKEVDSSTVGCDQRLGAEARRENQGDPSHMAPHHRAQVGGLTQRLHLGLWRLPRSVLLGPDHRGRAHPPAHCRLHRHHPQAQRQT